MEGRVFGHSPGRAVSATLPGSRAALGGREGGPCSWCLGAQEGFGGRPVLQRGLAAPRCAPVCSFCVTIPVSGKLSGEEAHPHTYL